MLKMITTLCCAACLAIAAFTGCVPTRDYSGLTKQQKEDLVRNAVDSALNTRHYRIVAKMMKPMRGDQTYLNSGFGLAVQGDTLDSYLPYVGAAYNVPYGGGNGLRFKAIISSYETATPKKGVREITIKARNSEDDYTYTLNVYDNGVVDIAVRSRERDFITYSGAMDI